MHSGFRYIHRCMARPADGGGRRAGGGDFCRDIVRNESSRGTNLPYEVKTNRQSRLEQRQALVRRLPGRGRWCAFEKIRQTPVLRFQLMLNGGARATGFTESRGGNGHRGGLDSVDFSWRISARKLHDGRSQHSSTPTCFVVVPTAATGIHLWMLRNEAAAGRLLRYTYGCCEMGGGRQNPKRDWIGLLFLVALLTT